MKEIGTVTYMWGTVSGTNPMAANERAWMPIVHRIGWATTESRRPVLMWVESVTPSKNATIGQIRATASA